MSFRVRLTLVAATAVALAVALASAVVYVVVRGELRAQLDDSLRDRATQVARARLFGLMSQYGWTLWASIQDGSSPMDFDFWSWGMEKYDRAAAEFEGPAFERLLEAAQRRDWRPSAAR